MEQNLENKSVRDPILEAAKKIPGLVLYKNPVGRGKVKTADGRYEQWITYGLQPGSADLIGYYTMDLSGLNVAVFVSIETKRPHGGHTAEAQRKWRDKVIERGGIALITNDPEEFMRVFSDGRAWERVRGLVK
ncbi:MAG: hypothetical protein HQL90_04350 [Magnetococcales bacterium]|nr:hypothetical protein [Magnetococcales bacterium]